MNNSLPQPAPPMSTSSTCPQQTFDHNQNPFCDNNNNNNRLLTTLTPLQVSLLLNSYAATAAAAAANASSSSSLSSSSSSSSSSSTNTPTTSASAVTNHLNLTHPYLNNPTRFNVSPSPLAQLTFHLQQLSLNSSNQQQQNRVQTAAATVPSPPVVMSTQPVDRTKLFVGNLPNGTTLTELFELFSPYGRINHQLCVVKDDNYAFIHFYTDKAAELAVRNVNGMLFRKRFLRVEYSVSDGHLRKLTRQFKDNMISIPIASFDSSVGGGSGMMMMKSSKSHFNFNFLNSSSFPSSGSMIAPGDASGSVSNSLPPLVGMRPIRGQRLTTSQSVNFTAI